MKMILDIIRKYFGLITAFSIMGFMIYWNDEGIDDKTSMPVPIEFLEKKKKKKEFKKHRKEFFEYMHQTDSNTNWREMDKKTRREKSENTKMILESMLDQGQLNRDDLSKTISKTNCILIPSYSEGFCFSAAESIGLKIPIISSNKGALKEVVSGKHIIMNKMKDISFQHTVKDNSCKMVCKVYDLGVQINYNTTINSPIKININLKFYYGVTLL